MSLNKNVETCLLKPKNRAVGDFTHLPNCKWYLCYSGMLHSRVW